MATVAKPATASTENDADPATLVPTSAVNELRRFDALTSEELQSDAWTEVLAVTQAVYATMGREFGTRLENAYGRCSDEAIGRALDRLVIGLVDEEGANVWELRMTRRSDFVPTFHREPNHVAADEELWRETHPEGLSA
jgi:hypothetical protein